MIHKTILKGIPKEENKIEHNTRSNIIYVSPDNLETLMSTIILKEYRPFIINQMKFEYRSELKKIIDAYDKNPNDYKIAVVRTKNLLSTEKKYNLDLSVKPYFINNQGIPFGEHTVEELKQYFEPKNLEQRIYSNSHLIE